MVISHNIEEANILYTNGATYVVMPHFLGGKYMSTIIDKYGFNSDKFSKERKIIKLAYNIKRKILPKLFSKHLQELHLGAI